MASRTFGDRWQVVRDLTPGGQAWTYVVEDLQREHPQCVLKRLKNLDRIKRFEQEIDVVKALDHLHILKLVDFNLSEKTPFLVAEYCSGGELKYDHLSDWTAVERLRLFETVAVALAYAHDKGIIHRDIKPSNILFRENGMAVLADFGICLNTEDGLKRLTEFQEQVGARFYMAPELADGRLEDVTPAADVYSMGKLLYWLFAGRVFDREKHELPDWDLRTTSDDYALLTIYDRLFRKTIVEDREQRFANATDLLQATKDVLEMLRKEGRYLDSNVPSSCIFCGIGKYVRAQIIPRIGRGLSNRHTPGKYDAYEVDYSTLYGLGSNQPSRLAAGNIEGGHFDSFLILKCDYCGNIQMFQLSNNTTWKNARPERPQTET